MDVLSRYMPAELVMNSQALSLKSVMDFIKVRLQCAVSLRDDICFDPVQNRELVCQQFGVSKTAAVIRLKQLGHLETRPYSEYSDPLEVWA